MIELLPRRGNIAELGTHRGDFARHILNVSDPTELHLIDLDLSLIQPSVAQDTRVSLHNGLTHQVIAEFPDSYFDWIYIDADHSYAGVTADAHAAAAKVRPGGLLVFNDFAHMDPFLGTYGVHRAVVEFVVQHGWPLVWIAYNPQALYDVAIQRPS